MIVELVARVDVGERVGLGHLKRVLSLCRQLKLKSIRVFFRGKLSEALKLQNQDVDFQQLSSDLSLSDEVLVLKEACKHGAPLLFDFSNRETLMWGNDLRGYFQQIGKVCSRVSVIDGLGSESLLEQNFIPDLSWSVFQPYVGAKRIQSDFLRQFDGPEYFVFDPKLMESRKEGAPTEVKNILVTFGGSDPAEITLWVLRMLNEVYQSSALRWDIVLGPLFSADYRLAIQKEARQRKLRCVFHDAPQDLFSLYRAADIAMSATGLSKYELTYCRIPALYISHSVEAASINLGFASLQTGIDLGAIQELTECQLNSNLNQLLSDFSLRNNLYSHCAKVLPKSTLGAYASSLGFQEREL